MKIVVWSYLEEGAAVAQRLARDFEVTVVHDKQDLPAALYGAAASVLENSRYDSQVAEWIRGSSVGWIQLLSAGYENLIAHGVPQGVAITSAAGTRSGAVAEHAIALLLGLVHALPAIIAAGRRERWSAHIAREVSSLEGKEALIIGYGSIGRAVAQRLSAFGMRITAANRGPVQDTLLARTLPLDSPDHALANADVVIVTVAFVPATRHLLAAREFEAMRPEAVLVNVSRGGVVSTEALVDALNARRIAGAALDVTDPEPLPPGHPLWRARNVLISPHLGGTTTSASSERLCALVLANAWHNLRGEPLEARIVL